MEDFLGDIGPLATLGISAWDPIAGMGAGALFGKFAADKMRRQEEAQRKREIHAKAAIIGTQWAPKAVSPDTVQVTPWRNPAAASQEGMTQGMALGKNFLDAAERKKEMEQLADMFKNKGASGDTSLTPQAATASVFGPFDNSNTVPVMSGKLRAQRGKFVNNYLKQAARSPASEDGESFPEDLPTLFGAFARGRGYRGYAATPY